MDHHQAEHTTARTKSKVRNTLHTIVSHNLQLPYSKVSFKKIQLQ